MNNTIIYHYTSLDALVSLFNSYSKEKPSLTFWASNCAFMNDPQEIKEGIRLIKNSMIGFKCPFVEQAMIRLLDHEHLYEMLILMSTKLNEGVPYAISFSLNNDNINMWNMYGDKGRGIILGFDRKIIENKLEKNLDDCYYYDSDNKDLIPIIQECVSLYIEKLKPCPEGFDKSHYFDIQMLRLINCLVPNVKNMSYKYEKEIRLNIIEKTPKFRCKNNIILPYTTIDIPIESLKSITIGPNFDERTVQAIKIMLWSRGLEYIHKNIYKSKVPYRD